MTKINKTQIKQCDIYYYVSKNDMSKPHGVPSPYRSGEWYLRPIECDYRWHNSNFYTYCSQLSDDELVKYFPRISGCVFDSSLIATGHVCFVEVDPGIGLKSGGVSRFIFSDGHKMVIVLRENLANFLRQHKHLSIFTCSKSVLRATCGFESFRLCSRLFTRAFWQSLCGFLGHVRIGTAILLSATCFTIEDKFWDEDIQKRLKTSGMLGNGAKYLPSLILTMLEQDPELSRYWKEFY